MRLGRTLVGGLAMALCAATAYADDAPADEKQAEPKPDEALDRDLDKSAVERVAQRSSGTNSQGTTAQSGKQQPPPDTDEEEAPVPKQLSAHVPWRGTAFAWSHEVTASAIGIGEDFQSSAHQSYVQTFSLGLNYFFVDQDKVSFALSTTPSVSVELTDSNTTTKRREPQFNDLPLSGTVRSIVYSHDSLPIATGVVVSTALVFPTSKPSYGRGTYLNVSPAATVWQSIPLLPKDVSPVFNAVYVGGSFRWSHRFGAATTPVNSDLQRPVARPSLGLLGQLNFDDQISYARLADNTLREGVFISFFENIGPTQLNLGAGFSFTQSYLRTLPAEQVDIATGKAPIAESEINTRYNYGFSAGLSFFPIPEAGISLGYANDNVESLRSDGRRRSIFYSPTAQFSAGLVVSIDAIYEAIIDQRRGSPFVLVADNKKKQDQDKRKAAPRGGIAF